MPSNFKYCHKWGVVPDDKNTNWYIKVIRPQGLITHQYCHLVYPIALIILPLCSVPTERIQSRSSWYMHLIKLYILYLLEALIVGGCRNVYWRKLIAHHTFSTRATSHPGQTKALFFTSLQPNDLPTDQPTHQVYIRPTKQTLYPFTINLTTIPDK